MPRAIISTETSPELATGRGGGGGGGGEGGDGGALGAIGGQLRSRAESVQVTMAMIFSVLIPPLVVSIGLLSVTWHLGVPPQPI